jgi:uncharacterized protein YlxP (DUF503 family)
VSRSAFVVVLLIHLHFPESGSLKAKRRELQSLKAQLRGRLGAAVAEVDHQDTWQRSTVAAALTAGTVVLANQEADAAERWLHERFPEGVRVERALASVEDLLGETTGERATSPSGGEY